MPESSLQVALITGPAYDHLYESLPEFTRLTGTAVEIGFRGVHPELNAHLAALDEVPYDLISTHTKYAPSQLRFLAALDEELLKDFYPAVAEMTKIDGRVYAIPRNIDVKLLHYRKDVVPMPPRSWGALVATAGALHREGFYGFVFPGSESGLFGMFFELAEMAGARLFPADGVPQLNNTGGRWALQTIRELFHAGTVPREIVDWQYDEAHAFFRDGHAAMICDWPGYYGSYRAVDSKVRETFGLARMPAGPRHLHKAYAGAHTFALTRQGAEKAAASDLLRFLTSPQQQVREARQGSVPVQPSVMAEISGEDHERMQLLDQVIANDTLIPPRLPYYPEIEEILWKTVRAAMTGVIAVETALTEMESRIRECHRSHRQAEALDAP